MAAVVRTAVPDELTEPGRLTVMTDAEESELEWRCLVREGRGCRPWLPAPLALEEVLLAEMEAVG